MHLGEPLGRAERLLEAVIFKKSVESVCRGGVINARCEWLVKIPYVVMVTHHVSELRLAVDDRHCVTFYTVCNSVCVQRHCYECLNLLA